MRKIICFFVVVAYFGVSFFKTIININSAKSHHQCQWAEIRYCYKNKFNRVPTFYFKCLNDTILFHFLVKWWK